MKLDADQRRALKRRVHEESKRRARSEQALERAQKRIASSFATPDDGLLPYAGDAESRGLTDREAVILTLIAEGLESSAIAERLILSPHTVNTHRNRMLRKLGACNAPHAVTIGFRQGLLT